MNCPNCSAEVPNDAQFCHNCGAAIPQPGEGQPLRARISRRLVLTAAGAGALAIVAAAIAAVLLVVQPFGGGDGGEDRGQVSDTGTFTPPTPTPSPPTPATEFVEIIAYVGTDGNVWTINPDGDNASQVTTNGDNAQPAWSPDGKKLAYIENRRYVHLADADGSGDERVPLRDDCADLWQRSARVTRIQFTSDGRGIRLGIDWGGVTNQFICHLVLDDSVSPLATVQGDEFGVTLKDARIVFTRSGQGCAWMYVIGPREANERQVGPTMGVGCTFEPEELSVYPYAPTWSPDGRTIAFYGVDLAARTSSVYTLDARDTASAQFRLEAGPASSLEGGALGLAWSPDGRFLAYEKAGSVWVLELAAGTTRKLVDGSNPAWGRVPSDLVPQPTPTPEPDISVPKPASCPVGDASFCDFVYQIDAALALGDISLIVSRTELTAHTCGNFADLEGPPLQGFSPFICEGQPRDAVPECVDWTHTGVAHPYYGCLAREEYVQELRSVSYTPTETSGNVAVIGIDLGCPDSGCQGTLFLRDATKPLSGDPLIDGGVSLTAVPRDGGWAISGGACCLPFLYGGYPEFSWQ